MAVIWKIAFRNLREHKTKTLIIGLIIAIGIMVLVVGNSLMDTAAAGIKKMYIDNYTGHIIISGQHQGGLSLFGSNNMNESVPLVPQYEKIEQHIASLPGVVAFSPQAVGQATVSIKDEVQGFVMLFGIDAERYRTMFPNNIELVTGRFLTPGEDGIMLSERSAKQLVDENDKPLAPGDSLVLTGMSMTGGTRIREVKIKGIFRFLNSNPQLNMVSLIDATSLRALMGMNVQAASDIKLDATEKALLGEVDEDSLFTGGDDALFSGSLVSEANTVKQKHSEKDLLNILGDKTSNPKEQNDSGAWHFLILKLKDPGQTERVRAELTKYFAAENIAADTQGWVEGAGVMASMTTGIKTVFNIIVLIVAVVAVIIIMNTLVISVTERLAEIGTMRAIGAQKGFVRKIITLETAIISGVFGLIGIVAGCLILLIYKQPPPKKNRKSG
jgi:putative ABC transport system permease protein